MSNLKTILEELIYKTGGGMPPYDTEEECAREEENAIAEALAKIEGMTNQELIKELEAILEHKNSVPVPFEVGTKPYIEGRLIKLKANMKGQK